jgi:hypothetical protein
MIAAGGGGGGGGAVLRPNRLVHDEGEVMYAKVEVKTLPPGQGSREGGQGTMAAEDQLCTYDRDEDAWVPTKVRIL